jgi:hypothetical protein
MLDTKLEYLLSSSQSLDNAVMPSKNQKLRDLLDSNERCVHTVLRFLFGEQTDVEQRSDRTFEKNSAGFNRPDAPRLGPPRKVTVGEPKPAEGHEKGE